MEKVQADIAEVERMLKALTCLCVARRQVKSLENKHLNP